MLEAVTPFIFMCRRPQAGTNLKLRDLAPPQGTSHCFKCPGLHLIGLPGASIIAILPYLGRRRLVSDDVWCLVGACACACACACVPVWHEPESDRSHNEEVIPQLQRQGEKWERERSSCTAKEHSNLQYNGMQWDIVDHRCFIIYSFMIIGRDFCPFASV